MADNKIISNFLILTIKLESIITFVHQFRSAENRFSTVYIVTFFKQIEE